MTIPGTAQRKSFKFSSQWFLGHFNPADFFAAHTRSVTRTILHTFFLQAYFSSISVIFLTHKSPQMFCAGFLLKWWVFFMEYPRFKSINRDGPMRGNVIDLSCRHCMLNVVRCFWIIEYRFRTDIFSLKIVYLNLCFYSLLWISVFVHFTVSNIFV